MPPTPEIHVPLLILQRAHSSASDCKPRVFVPAKCVLDVLRNRNLSRFLQLYFHLPANRFHSMEDLGQSGLSGLYRYALQPCICDCYISSSADQLKQCYPNHTVRCHTVLQLTKAGILRHSVAKNIGCFCGELHTYPDCHRWYFSFSPRLQRLSSATAFVSSLRASRHLRARLEPPFHPR